MILNMKSLYCKILCAFLLFLAVGQVQAGERDKRIGFNAGVLYPRIFNVTLQYEWETTYYNAWECYFDYATQWNDCPQCGKVCMDSFWKEHYAYGFGLAYKPAIHRGKNSVARFRIGSDIGASKQSFALGVELGFEYVWTLRNGIQLVAQQKNEVTFWSKPRFKNGALLGIRFPLF